MVDFGYSAERRCCIGRVEQTGCCYLRKMHPRYRNSALALSVRRGSEDNVKREASGLTDKSAADKRRSSSERRAEVREISREFVIGSGVIAPMYV